MIEFGNIKIFTDNIDQKALDQLHDLVGTGVFSDQPIRIMPDVHAGKGSVIGFTVPIKDKVIPNIVGVDIGCGMLCVPLGQVDINFAALDAIIKARVPSGRDVGVFSPVARELISTLRCKEHLRNLDWLERSLGTLGGGNHFIEVDRDDDGCLYLIIHSGSRNLGKQVAEYYQEVAIKERKTIDTKAIIAQLKAEGRDKEIQSALEAAKLTTPKIADALCYLTGPSLEDYLHDAQVCSRFADENRIAIAFNILQRVSAMVLPGLLCSFTTRHNYISDDGYIRKGAIEAKQGQRVLIPLNMRDGCIIGIGKGNPDWNFSAPHGAGRVMSRMQARVQLKLNDYEQSMEGIYTTSVNEQTIDEAPFCYKPAQEIIDLVQETVEIERILKPVYNFKASEVQDD